MGLSSFNAMRARKRAMEQANANSKPAPIEVKEVENPPILDEIEPEKKSEKIVQEKKTDAEKLKKKKD